MGKISFFKIVILSSILSLNGLAQNYWQPTPNGTSGDNISLAINDNGTLLAASWQNGIYRSENKGSSWTQIGKDDVYIQDIVTMPDNSFLAFYSSQNGYSIYRSVDEGVTWQEVYQAQHNFNWFWSGDIVFMDDKVGVAIISFTIGPTIGDIGSDVLRTNDGGATWQFETLMPFSSMVNGMVKLDDGRIFAGTGIQGIKVSSDTGSTWQQLPSWPPLAAYVGKMAIDSKGNIFAAQDNAASEQDMIYRSENNGTSWIQSGLPGGFDGGDINDIYIDSSDNVYVAHLSSPSFYYTIYHSNDNGVTWEDLNAGLPANTGINALTGDQQDRIFAGLDNGGIYMNVESVSNLDEEEPGTPLMFELMQNYPNPFNPKTNIRFRITAAGNVSLKVFDVLGKQVAELVNESKPAGEFTVQFDASNLSSGIYWYRLESAGVTKVRKMIVAK